MATTLGVAHGIALALDIALALGPPIAPTVFASALGRVRTPLARALGDMLLVLVVVLCGLADAALPVQEVQGYLWVGRAGVGGWMVVDGGVDARGGGCGARAGAWAAGGNVQG